jgi:hypothetical protein
VKSKLIITILENNIDLSRLKVTAFEISRNTNKDINIIPEYKKKKEKKKKKKVFFVGVFL